MSQLDIALTLFGIGLAINALMTSWAFYEATRAGQAVKELEQRAEWLESHERSRFNSKEHAPDYE